MEEEETGSSPEVALWRPPPTAVDLLKALQHQAGATGDGEVSEGGDVVGAAAACCSSLRRILHLSSLLPTFSNKALAMAESLLQAHVALASTAPSSGATAPPHLALSRLVEFSHIARCSETLLSLIARYNAWAPRAWASTVLLLQKETPFNPVLRASLAQTLQDLNHFAEELLACHEELRKMRGTLMLPSSRASPRPRGHPCLHVCVLIISITLACALLCFVSK